MTVGCFFYACVSKYDDDDDDDDVQLGRLARFPSFIYIICVTHPWR